MPVPTIVAAAAENFRFNTGFLEKTVADLSPEEWLKRPSENANHVAWIAGHLVASRKGLLGRLGRQWDQPWLRLFARGAKIEAETVYPSAETLLNAWRESAAELNSALENVSEDLLAQPVTQGPPSADGKQSGVVNFMAIHETYHIGQVSYLRSWLGHKGLMG